MSEFNVRADAPFYPNTCVCGSNTATPIVDTGYEILHGYRVYLCAKCVRNAAQVTGHASPEDVAAGVAKIQADAARIAELEAELEAERGNKLVSLADVRELVAATTPVASKKRGRFVHGDAA